MRPTPLGWFATALLAMQFAINVAYGLGRLRSENIPALVDLNAAASLPAWWSSLLLAGLAILALTLAWSDGSRRQTPLWIVASVVFVYLSFDEVVGLHERLGRDAGSDGTNGREWVLILGPAFIAIAVALSRLLRSLSSQQRRLAIAGVGLYVIALGAEAATIVSEAAETRAVVWIEENAEILGSGMLLVALAAAAVDRVSLTRRRRPALG